MPYPATQTFWVERSGRWRATVHRDKIGNREVLGDFDSEALAQAATDAEWAKCDLAGSGLEPMYRLPDGREVPSHELPPGAMYDATWLHEIFPMPDGICLAVICPNGHTWIVDSRASNCTMPDDKVHRCWVRHGNPRCDRVHVDKQGPTCQAGAGSIICHDYHGFLHHGVLTAG